MMRIFSDFDGTIAVQDVGSRLFRTFAGARATAIVQEYLDGTITARACLTRECDAVADVRREDVEKLVDECTLDPTFDAFVGFCRQKELPLLVLSDGLDFYVGRLLGKYGYGHVPFFSNHLEFVPSGTMTKLVPSFPHTDSECLLCGNCKRNHLLTNSADEDIIVYIGDGISDRCPVRYADIVFAKGSLIRYCQEQNVTYHEFRNFDDVRQRLDTILRQKRIKKRREAEMARRDVFAQG
jgi:2-hydroxy-3-keto-5-methylthiopentenyl-1-phosphate phosphatase